jgi:DNA repair exonuclease SbcCD nuclease subunit
MSIRILCIGDIHIKPTTIHLVDLLEVQVLNYISAHDIHLVVLLGDVLNTFEKLHTQAVNRAYQFIDKLRTCGPHIYILVGNHDYINNQQFQTDQHWMNALKQWDKVQIVDQKIYSKDGLLCFVPYVPIGRFSEAVSEVGGGGSSSSNPILIFAHQEFRGCKMGAITSVEGDMWDLSNPMVISGHIHESQKPQKNIWYPGAAIQNCFGTTKDPNLLKIVVSENKTLEFTELPIHLPKKKTIYIREGEMTTDRVHDILKLARRDEIDQVKIVYESTFEQFKQFSKSCIYAELVSSAIRIVHKFPTVTETIISSSSSSSDFIQSGSDFKQLLHMRILRKKNELLYSVYASIVSNLEIDPKNILIV